MKILSILVLATMTLWNPSMALADSGTDLTVAPLVNATTLHPFSITEKEIDDVTVKFENPLHDVEENLKTYSNLIGIFNQFKVYDIALTNDLLAKIKNHETLSGAELFELRRTITIYYKINKKILDFARVYDFGGFKMSKTFANEERNMPLIKAHLIWLSGHLFVLDHLEAMHGILYDSDSVFRRIVKNALLDKSEDAEGTTKTLNDLIKMSKYTVEIGESQKFSQQINLVLAIKDDLKSILTGEASASQLVDEIVANKTSTDIAQGKTKFEVRNFTFTDSITDLLNATVGWLSKIFGNIAGAIHWREGHLYKNPTALKMATDNLQPMDIIIEKSPFVLTDKFIPGHFGHVAVYLGTKEQLQAINMWNHPDIIPYQDDIEAGRVILEAVRSGVRLNSVAEFLNIDELSIVRKEDGLANPSLLIEEITRGMDQIGKAYDFNFDISTLDKIVCSELIYIVYGNVNWPTQYRFGRPTITPDDVAEILFEKGTKFHIQSFMVAKEDHRIELVDRSYIADELDYELRANDGTVIQDQQDPTNSYWKKETKCYNVTAYDAPGNGDSSPGGRYLTKHLCKTSFKQFDYEEKDTI